MKLPHSCRVGQVLDLVSHATGGRLGRHLDDSTFDIHFPAMIKTPQPAIFVTTERKRSLSVWTVFVHNAHPAFRVPEYHQVFAKYTSSHRGAVRFADFFDQAHRLPVAAHQLAHRRVALDAA